MTYERALKAAEKTGISNAEGLSHLAITVQTLSLGHAVSPKLIFDGAVHRGLSASDVRKLTVLELADLMFV